MVFRERVSVEEDEPSGRSRSAVTDQNIVKIRGRVGSLSHRVVILLINIAIEVLKRFREEIGERPELRDDEWLLHQDKASPICQVFSD
ncbi:hypothetical protein TNCV_3336201 [Trichonephila clavipes]|nr:hypothetical protein TNCV_3336201 [Trichonephila clavipes]